MELKEFKGQNIEKYYKKNNLEKSISLVDFEYCLYFISKNWQRYLDAKKKQSLIPIKFTYKGKQTAVYEQALNLIFLKTLEQTSGNGLQKLCKAKIKEVEKRWGNLNINSKQLEKAVATFKPAITYAINKSAMPIRNKTGYKGKWQEFVVSDYANQPELIELQMFLMNTDHVLVKLYRILKDLKTEELEKQEK